MNGAPQSSTRTRVRAACARAYPGARIALVPTTGSAQAVVVRVATAAGTLYVKTPADVAGAPAQHAADALAHETILARAASAVGATVRAPPRTLLAALPVRAALVTAAVVGRAPRTWSFDDVALVGGGLARLHAVRPPAGARALTHGGSVHTVVHEGHSLLAAVRAHGALAHKDQRALEDAWAQAIAPVRAFVGVAQLASDAPFEPRALCHGDVRPQNVRFVNGAARFIDFELGGIGDPAIDLARTAAYAALSRHAFFRLLDAYADTSRDEEAVGRAVMLRPVATLLVALASALRSVRAPSADAQTRAVRALSAVLGRPVNVRVKKTLPRRSAR